MNGLDLIIALFSGSLVLMAYSFLYRESLWFTIAEHFMIGGLAGYAASTGVKQFINQGLVPVTQGKFIYIFGIIGGVLLFSTFSKEMAWWTRLPIAVLVGTGIGVNIRAGIQTQITAQMIDTIKPLLSSDLVSNLNNLIIIVGVVTVLTHFTFTRESKGTVLPTITRIGRIFLMIAFGCSFAFQILGKGASFIARFQDILSYPNYYLIPIAALFILYDIYIHRKSTG